MGFFGWRRKTGKKNNGCRLCGTCCRAFGGHLRVSKSDLKRWQEEEREDILDHVNRLGWLWVNPETGKLLPECPYITELEDKKVVCGIHDTKPEMCRAYPTLAHERRCATGRVFN